MKLSTAQFLRRDYESDYGTQRRLIWANRLQWGSKTLRNIKSQLVFKGADISAVETFKDLSALIHKGEPDLAPSDELILDGYWPDRAIRNCPQCARLIYHSSLYQLPWLKYCPFHHCRIVKRCPDCGRPWQKPYECRFHKCTTCGIAIPLTMLVERQCTDSNVTKKLRRLAACLAATRSSPRLNLKCADKTKGGRPFSADHKSIDMFDPYYPSLVVQRDSRFRSVFSALKVDIPKLSRFCFTSNDHLVHQDIDEVVLFNAAAKRIRRQVLCRYGFDLTSKPKFFSPDYYCHKNVIETAWHALHYIFDCDRGNGRKSKYFLTTEDFMLGVGFPPMLVSPTSMLRIELPDSQLYDGDRMDNSWTDEMLPASASKIIYQASLCCLFRRLVEFYDNLACARLRIGRWSRYRGEPLAINHLESELPDIANPLLPTNIHLCVCVNRGQLVVALPTEYYLGSLDDITLKSPITPPTAPKIL